MGAPRTFLLADFLLSSRPFYQNSRTGGTRPPEAEGTKTGPAVFFEMSAFPQGLEAQAKARGPPIVYAVRENYSSARHSAIWRRRSMAQASLSARRVAGGGTSGVPQSRQQAPAVAGDPHLPQTLASTSPQ